MLIREAEEKRRILNVGCGSETYGTDFVDMYPQRPEVKQADVDGAVLPYESDTFDEVYSKNLLEHLTNLGATFKEFHRLLNDGGRMVAITDNASYWVWAVGKTHHGAYHSSGGADDRHYCLFTPEHLVNLAKKAGFSSVQAELIIDPKDSLMIRSFNRLIRFGVTRRFSYKRIRLIAEK